MVVVHRVFHQYKNSEYFQNLSNILNTFLSTVKESLKFCLFFRSGSGVGLDFYVLRLFLGCV